jgi:agmatine/peptidylarginine deiminase
VNSCTVVYITPIFAVNLGVIKSVRCSQKPTAVILVSDLLCLHARFPNTEIELISAHDQKVPSESEWTLPGSNEHSKKTIEHFKQNGFEVLTVKNPVPYLTLTREIFESSDKKVVYEKIRADFVHRSYANSLILNGKVFVPQYPLTAAADLDKNALEIYKQAGLQPTPIPSDFSILGGGSVHCLTKEIAR